MRRTLLIAGALCAAAAIAQTEPAPAVTAPADVTVKPSAAAEKKPEVAPAPDASPPPAKTTEAKAPPSKPIQVVPAVGTPSAQPKPAVASEPAEAKPASGTVAAEAVKPPEQKPAESKPAPKPAVASEPAKAKPAVAVQPEQPPAPKPAAAIAPKPQPKPEPAHETPAHAALAELEMTDEEAVAYEARLFFLDILSSDARGLAQRATFPFHLEDRRFSNEDELFAVWLKNMQQKRTDLLSLYGIEVLSPADMEKKYGRPPARLSSFPYKGSRTFVAVGNLSGRAAVVVFKQVGSRWRAVAYHD